MIVTLQQLQNVDICDTSLFLEICPTGRSGNIEWTPAAQGFFLSLPLRKHFGWLVWKQILPMWSMAGVDFSGVNLQDADLQDAILWGANLKDADLRYADLRYANLKDADLRYADLRYADLRYANLQGAILWGANLKDAEIDETTIIDKKWRPS